MTKIGSNQPRPLAPAKGAHTTPAQPKEIPPPTSGGWTPKAAAAQSEALGGGSRVGKPGWATPDGLRDVFAVAPRYLSDDATLRALQDLNGEEKHRKAAIALLTPIAERAIRETPALSKRFSTAAPSSWTPKTADAAGSGSRVGKPGWATPDTLRDVFGDPAVATKYLSDDATFRAYQDLNGGDEHRQAAIALLTPIAERAIRETPVLSKRYGL